MSAGQNCPRCRAALPAEGMGGLCPRCIIRVSLESPAAGPEGTVFVNPALTSPRPSALSGPSASLGTLRYFGDYELLEEIARGGMGVVFRARQVSLNRIVAVKMILAGQLASEADVKRFLAEAEAAANLQHPNIVAIHEVGEHEGQYYFSMDFIEGRSLAELVRDGPLPAQRAARYVQIIAEAIHYAHQRGTLHRDLKPSNVLIDAHDRPQVTDFGLAKRVESNSDLTLTGQVLGSPNFMPPEQAAGQTGNIGPPSDVYGLGAILYHLLTARPPFVAGTVHETLMQVISAEPALPRLLNSTVPRDLETICLKCLEKNPQRRYGSADGLAGELGRFLNGEPIHARPANALERAVKWAHRRPAIAALLALMSLVGTGGMWGIFWQWRKAEAARAAIAVKATAAERAQQAEARESYAAKLALVTAKIEKNELNRAREILDSCPPRLRHWEWGRLRQLCMAGPRILEGHLGAVNDLAFTPDGRRLITAGSFPVRIWDVEQGRHLITLGTSASFVSGNRQPNFGLSSDGGQVITAVHNEVRVWDIASGERIRTIAVSNRVGWLSRDGSRVFADNGRKSTNGGMLIEEHRAWDVSTGDLVGTVRDPGAFRMLKAVSPDGRWILTQARAVRAEETPPAGQRSRVKALPLCWSIWHSAGGQLAARLTESATDLEFATFSPDGRMLFTLAGATREEAQAKQRRATLWETESGRPIARLVLPQGSYGKFGTTFSADSRRLLTAIQDSSKSITVDIWASSNGYHIATLDRHADFPTGVALSADGALAVTASSGARVWNCSNGLEMARLEGHVGPVHCAAFSPDGHRVATGGEDKTARIWDLQARPLYLTLSTNLDREAEAALAVGGRRILLFHRHGARNGSVVRVLETDTGREIARLEFTNYLERATLSSDGTRLLTWKHAGYFFNNPATELEVADLDSGRIFQRIRGEDVGMAPGWGRIVGLETTEIPGGGDDRYVQKVTAWDAATGAQVYSEEFLNRHLRLLADGRHALSGSSTGNPGKNDVLDLHDRRVIASVTLSNLALFLPERVSRFLPKQSRLLVMGTEQTAQNKVRCVKLLDARNDRVLSSLILESVKGDLHYERTEVEDVSAQGDRFVLYSFLQGVHRLWLCDTDSGQFRELVGHSDAISSAAFFPDGGRVVTSSQDRTARVWDSETGRELIALPHTSAVSHAAVTPDGRRIITISKDWGLVAWTAAEWNETKISNTNSK